MGKITLLFGKNKNAKKENQWAILKKILPLTKKYGPDVFYPYGPLIADIQAQEPSLNEIAQIYNILIHTETPIPDYWIDIIKEYNGEDAKSEPHIALLSVAHFASSGNAIFENFPLNADDIKPILNTALGQNLIIFMKTVDKLENSVKNNSAYEKDFYLTTASGYVMPTAVVWDRLKKLENSKAIGETILLSTLSLHGTSMHKIYPSLLRDILLSTQNVNLTKLSKNLAIAAVLDSAN